MNKNEQEYAVLANAIDTISVICAGDRDKIIDLLAEYLFTPEETEKIRASSGRWDIVDDVEKEISSIERHAKELERNNLWDDVDSYGPSA